jgi:hypothetical protein
MVDRLILTQEEENILFNLFFPLGNVLKYDPTTKLVNTLESPMRRYILDSNNTKKTFKSDILSMKGKFDCNFLSYGFFETLNVIMQEDYELYIKLYNYFDNLDFLMSKFINSTVNKTVLFSNKKFGEKLFTHIHLDNNVRHDTLSLFFRLTNKTEERPRLILYDNLTEDSRILTKGYMDFRKLTHHEKTSKSIEEVLINDLDVIKFDASTVPHSFTYNDDLWVTMVYDHAITKNITMKKHNRFMKEGLNTIIKLL